MPGDASELKHKSHSSAAADRNYPVMAANGSAIIRVGDGTLSCLITPS